MKEFTAKEARDMANKCDYALHKNICSNWDEVRTMRGNFYKVDGSI